MTIKKELNDESLVISIEGRLDTVTSPQLEGVLNAELNGVNDLVFDLENLDYISSAGLRVLLLAKKSMSNGTMKLKNVKPAILDVLKITGFLSIIDVE